MSLFFTPRLRHRGSRGLPRRSWSLEIALNTVLSVCNLQRSCLLRQTFWDAIQASCDHQKKFSHASFSTVTGQLLKLLHPHNQNLDYELLVSLARPQQLDFRGASGTN